jgi:hypothetical protein
MDREEALRRLPSEEEMAEQIQREWERMHQRGQEIRVGDASERAFRRFWGARGAELVKMLRRRADEG